MQTIILWAVGLSVTILIVLCPSILRMSNRMAIQDERQGRHEETSKERFERMEKSLEKQEAHNERQDTQINEIGKVMARVDERTEHIAKGLERVGVIPPHQ